MEGSAVLSRSAAGRTRQERLRSPFVQRYWAFLSYAHEDSATADWLHRALESFRVPKPLVGRRAERFLIPARLSPVFRDRSELAAATDLSEDIQEALDSSRHLIVLCSPAAAQSHWVDEEIRTFKQFRPDGEVLAAIVGGEPWASNMPGREAEECFPPALRERFDEDGRPTGELAEPIAADLRPEGDGRERGLLKIVAGMLDLRLDELVQRDEVERHRRWALIAAASVAGMLLTSGLAVTAIQSRDAARDQRREAESLIGFMIGDLRDKLEPVGRLDALEAVGSRVLSYYDRQDRAKLSDEALAQRAKALTLMIDLAQRRGDLDGALRLYRLGSAGTAEALRRDPDNPQRLYDHAQNIFRIGDIARTRGDMKTLEASSREYKRLADRMVELDSSDPRWRVETRYADTNLGIVYFNQQRFDQASRLFGHSLEVSERLAAAQPANRQYQELLWESLAWLADSRSGEGRLNEAMRLRSRQIALITAAMRQDPQDVQYRKRSLPARRALGRLLGTTGTLDGGLAQMTTAVRDSQALLSAEPDNVEWLQSAAGLELDRAGLLLLASRRDEAAAQLQHACGLVDALAKRDPTSDTTLSVRLDCLERGARVALASGSLSTASVLAGQALALAQASSQGDPIRRALRLVNAYRLIGDVHAKAGNRPGAQSAWNQALAAWPRVPAENPRQMAIRAELLRNVGRQDDARLLAERLKATGYRMTI